MPIFTQRRFRPTTLTPGNSTIGERLGARYRSSLARHPFLLFGLPFLTTIVAGSFFLTPATALRYERHDRKVQRMTQEEAMGLAKDRRRLDINEEYYVSVTTPLPTSAPLTYSPTPTHTHIYIYTQQATIPFGGGALYSCCGAVLDNSLGIDTRGEDCRMLIILLICWAGRDLLLRM